jgi:hypothetical protein
VLPAFETYAVAVPVMVIVEHLLLGTVAKKYYGTHVPHYNSTGSYTAAYEVLNAYSNEGWWAAAKFATFIKVTVQ